MLQADELSYNRQIKEGFLKDWPIVDEYCLKDGQTPFGYIYCIINKTTGRRYIGSTYAIYAGVQHPRARHSLSKRASQYIYEWNRSRKHDSVNSIKAQRPIIRAMTAEGIENFMMFPIAETTKENHTAMENYFIKFYDSINRGYNTNEAGKSFRSNLPKLTEADKKLRSEPIIAVHVGYKQIVYADSMKLLADYLGITKDMIKNITRKGMPYKGWYSFYIDKTKREYILYNNVINDQDKRTQDRHSDRTKQFYRGLYDSIDGYINSRQNSEYFSDFTRLPDLEYDT